MIILKVLFTVIIMTRLFHKLTLIAALFISVYGSAQTCDTINYQTILWNIHNNDAQPQFMFTDAQRNLYFAGSTNSDMGMNSVSGGWLMKTTPRGTPLWSHFVGSNISAGIGGDNIASIKMTSDGGFILAGESKNGQALYIGWLARLDADGHLLWNVEMGAEVTQLNDVTELSDGSFVAVGHLILGYKYDANYNLIDYSISRSIMVRVDRNGKTLWWRSFHDLQLDDLTAVQKLSDGNFIVLGTSGTRYVTGYNYIMKVNASNGQFIWNNQYDPQLQNDNGKIIELPDHSIKVLNGCNRFYFDKDGKWMGGSYFNLADPSMVNSNSYIYIGTRNGNEDFYLIDLWTYSLGLIDIKNDSTVLWSWKYSNDRTHGDLDFGRNGLVTDNSIYLCSSFGRIKFDSSVDKCTYYIQTDQNGQTPCAEPLGLPFIFTPVSSVNNSSFFTDDGQLKPAIQPGYYDQSLKAAKVVDCYKFRCCRDTMLFNDVSICTGQSFTLPDGESVSKEGIYSYPLKRVAGCDSVIFTTVRVKNDIHISLGRDTCLENNSMLSYNVAIPDSSVTYLWQDGSVSSTYNIRDSGTYWVKATSGCNSVSDTLRVLKNCDLPFYIPSGFTPNHDGLNDIFRISNLNGQRLTDFTIYSRYGNRVFHTSEERKGWDGTINGRPAPAGIYVYLIRYNDLSGKEHLAKGTLALIR